VIRSMTGFAAVSREEGGAKVNVTVKSVNHRFLDVQIRAPQTLAALESRIRALLQQGLTRGRVEITLSIEVTTAPPREVVLDDGLLERITQALDAARARGLVTGALSVSDVLRIPQVLDIRPRGEGAATSVPESVALLVDLVIRDAVDALVMMRDTEGRFLNGDLSARLSTLAGFVNNLERLALEGQGQLEARLRERLAALPVDLAGDPAAVAQEIVRFVARSDVDEEIVRMRGHLDHWRQLTEGPEPCGRKLDFLVQEMNREINTIGSKVESGKAIELVIAAKAELERVREQVQNVE
jgi:uncharacterized protein (TIGR00255 family)